MSKFQHAIMALDTSCLLELGSEVSGTTIMLRSCKEHGVYFVIPPHVLTEIRHAVPRPESFFQETASFNILIPDFNSTLYREAKALTIQNQKHLPVSLTENECRIIAESTLLGASAFVTLDHRLIDMRFVEKLTTLLMRQNLQMPTMETPESVLEKLRGQGPMSPSSPGMKFMDYPSGRF